MKSFVHLKWRHAQLCTKYIISPLLCAQSCLTISLAGLVHIETADTLSHPVFRAPLYKLGNCFSEYPLGASWDDRTPRGPSGFVLLGNRPHGLLDLCCDAWALLRSWGHACMQAQDVNTRLRMELSLERERRKAAMDALAGDP